MSKGFSIVSLLTIASGLAFAQEAPESPEKPKLPKVADALLKQVPTDLDAIKQQSEFLLKNVPAAPLPAGNPKLDKMRERSRKLIEKHASYTKEVASGKVDPFAHVRRLRPQHERDISSLKGHISQLNDEKIPSKRLEISKLIFAALQPIGEYLEDASPGKGYTNILDKHQQAELIRLEAAWDAADKDYKTTQEPLQIIGSGQLYTITNLSVPISVQAPPSSKVIFQTFGGGFFGNKLPLIEVQADKAGIAIAEWVSYGYSIGDTVIGVLSKDAPPAGDLTITTVQLKLPALSEFPQKVPAIPPVKSPAQ